MPQRYYAVHEKWKGNFVLNDDGTFIGGDPNTGNGTWEQVKEGIIILKWYNWTAQYLNLQPDGSYSDKRLCLYKLKDCRIFCVGLHRTATRSLCEALNLLGYPAMHYRGNRNKFNKMSNGDFSCFDNDGYVCCYADVPIPFFYKELYENFPNSKFILNIRDEETWLNSIKRHLSQLTPRQRSQLDHSIHKYFYGVNLNAPVDDELYLEKYRIHNNNVREFFKDNPNFIEYNVIAENSWETLCAFLGEEVPDKPFPHKGG
jgi:hypothetical protein